MIFVTYSLNSYDVLVAKASFETATDVTWNFSTNRTIGPQLNEQYGPLVTAMSELTKQRALLRYNASDCLDKFAVPLQSAYGNIVLITNKTQQGGGIPDFVLTPEQKALKDFLGGGKEDQTTDVFGYYHAGIPTEDAGSTGEQYMWICDQREATGNNSCLYQSENIRGNMGNWTLMGGERVVDHCLVQETPEQCKLQVSLTMSLICIGTIMFKVLVMFAVAILVNESPIMTTGDAIETFMKDPDPYTQGMCMASKKLIEQNPHHWPRAPLFVYLKKWRWGHGVQTRIAFFCLR